MIDEVDSEIEENAVAEKEKNIDPVVDTIPGDKASHMKSAIKDALDTDFMSAVPKDKQKKAISVASIKNGKKILGLVKWCSSFALAFFMTYWLLMSSYENKVIANAPKGIYPLYNLTTALEAREMFYRGITNARNNVVLVLPTQYGLDTELYKLLNLKAKQGVQLIIVLSSLDANYSAIRGYIEYYTGNNALIASIPTPLYETISLLDNSYVMQTSAPISNTFGKIPMQGDLTIYKDSNHVRSLKTYIANLQEAFKE